MDPVAEPDDRGRGDRRRRWPATAAAAAKLDRPPQADFGDYSTNAAMLLAPDARRAAARGRGAARRAAGRAAGRDGRAGRGRGARASSTCSWPTPGTSRRWPRCSRRATTTGAERRRAREPRVRERQPDRADHDRLRAHAAYGDSLCRILERAGHRVEREYYVNDAGTQVRRFGESIQARARGEEPPEDGYRAST